MLACGFFLARGPYRALRFSTAGDFATIYGSARCWLAGLNPYDRANVKNALEQARAPESVRRDQDVNPSVYLPSALLFMVPVAILPWQTANLVWCLASLAVWVMALWKILASVDLRCHTKWLIAAAAIVFSPSYVGMYDGNPSVLVISLVALAILSKSRVASGILLGIALCFKPQIAFCAICVLVLRRRWRALAVAVAVFAIVLLAGTVRHARWWQSEQRNIALSFESGGQSDPAPNSHVAWQFLNAQTLVSYVFPERALWNPAVWLIGAVLIGVFLRGSGNREWQAVAFFAALTLTLTYHRYYDGQLLLLAIPFLVELWRSDRRKRILLAVVCLILLAFPIQSVFARKLANEARLPSVKQALLLRNQPAAVLGLAILFVLPLRREKK